MKPPASGAFTTVPNWMNAAQKKPLDKDPAESLVNQTYRYFYSRICRDTFFSYDELNIKLDELNDMFNNRTAGTRHTAAGNSMNERKQGDVQWRPHVHVCGGCQHYEDACAIHGGPGRRESFRD